jgi:hypothetical protein
VVLLLRHHGGHRALRLLSTRVAGAAVLAAALASCGDAPRADQRTHEGTNVGTSESAITNGTATTGDLGVAALLQGGTLLCTATLIAPRVLLTAAHCLPGAPYPDAFFGSAPAGAGTTLHVIAVLRDPTFDASALTDDIAMALLDGDAPAGATPWPLPTTLLGASSVGLALRLVGFGRTGPSDTTPAEKRVGTAIVGSLTPTELTFSPSPSQTCSGDSGGPAFATSDGVEAIVAVTSSGDPSCAQTATDTRVDAYESFITPWLAATAEGGAAAGGRCWYAANCAASAGTCAAALDDATLSFCAPACGASDACPAGLQCLAGSDGARLCRHPTPSPGALGSACHAATDCADATCLAPASNGGSVCTLSCFQDLPGFCASGYTCATVADQDGGASACFAPATASRANANSGCNAGGANDSGDAIVGLLIAATIALRRRYGSVFFRGRAMPY